MCDKAKVSKVVLHIGVKSCFNGRLFDRFIGEFVIEILGKFWVGLISDVSAMTKVTAEREDQTYNNRYNGWLYFALQHIFPLDTSEPFVCLNLLCAIITITETGIWILA